MSADLLTVTVARARVGGWVGDTLAHPDLLEAIAPRLERDADAGGLLLDFTVTHAGDSLAIVLSHRRGAGARDVHAAALAAFSAASDEAKRRKLHRAASPGPLAVAEIEFRERESEPVVAFLSTGASAGAFNAPLSRAFADPFLHRVDDAALARGFRFEVADPAGKDVGAFLSPEETPALLRAFERGGILQAVRARDGPHPAASISRPTSDDDPVAIVRAESGFPPVASLLEPWAGPALARGPRGVVPLAPSSVADAQRSRLAAPACVVALGFTVAHGEMTGPVDLFADPAFDRARAEARRIAEAVAESR